MPTDQPFFSRRIIYFLFIIVFVSLGLLALSSYLRQSGTNYAPHEFLNIQHITTNSEINAWLVEDHSLPIIAMNYSFRGAGAKNDPLDKQGLARLVSNTMDEGAGNMNAQAFQKTLQDKSIALSFSVSRDHFNGVLKTLTQNKDDAFRLLALALTQPRFDEKPLERMRIANQSRIRSSLSDPHWIAARLQNDRIFEGHSYAMNSGGTISSLEKITTDDLRAFHKTLGKNQLVIGVAGDITADELKQRLEEIFASLPVIEPNAPEKHPLRNAGKTYLYKQNIPQTIIEIAQEGISRQDEAFYSAYLMNFILGASGFGSRLMEEIREKRGLTYGIYTYFRQYDEADLLNISTSTANNNVPEMLDLIYKEWDKMRNTPVSEKELAEAKSYIIGSLPLSLTSTNSIAKILLSLQLDYLPIDYLDNRENKINAVNIDNIEAISKRLLDIEKMTTIMVGNPPALTGIAGKSIGVNIMTELPNVK
ncbi:MAG: insulinase family protein [Alphaproteobacteria bacterium]|nr:insulinase family protein [Alphaproteobacteria bacterium]